MRGNGDEPFERSSLKLLRRAMAHGDPEAWAGFQQCLEETVLTWLHEHPGGEAACRGLCEKDVVGQANEPCVENQLDSHEIWELLQTLLLIARERRLAYLLYHCGLGPREIVQCCPQEWTDVQEIYCLRRDIVERLLHHANIQESR